MSLCNLHDIIEQFREEGGYFSSSKPNNNVYNNLCIACRKVKVNPQFVPYCGPMCRDYYNSKTRYELKDLLREEGEARGE